MNEQDQRIAIAEALPKLFYIDTFSKELWWIAPFQLTAIKVDRFNDLNACHEMEETLTPDQRASYAKALYYTIPEANISCYQDDLQFDEYWELIHATAAQRCEAFLRTKNLWKG